MHRFSIENVIAGFIVAPIVPAISFYIYSYVMGDYWPISFFVGVAIIAGYPTIIIFGVPLYIYLSRRGIESVLVYLVLGLVLGVAAYLVVFAPGIFYGDPGVWYALRTWMPLLFLSALCGGIGGVTFWVTAVWRNSYQTRGQEE